MKINNIQQISEIYGVSSVKQVSSNSKTNNNNDKLEISNRARDYQTGLNAIKSSPDIRENKVKKIKKQIESGTYNVSAEEVAKKMMAEFFDHSI